TSKTLTGFVLFFSATSPFFDTGIKLPAFLADFFIDQNLAAFDCRLESPGGINHVTDDRKIQPAQGGGADILNHRVGEGFKNVFAGITDLLCFGIFLRCCF
ncbi:MAG TPA: hypothetical protein PK228_19535, partial [Saprospiraceae bacterium]|nr:hypothetical protein [Saprospiraceae bacterium]